jgi:hypothetical protein
MQRRTFLLTPALAAAAQPSSGALSLFDGKTLAGWKIEQGPETAFYVNDGAIVVHESANYPTWLRSEREYENFDFRGEFFVKGWIDSGIYLHAPLHGRPTWEGIQVKIFHQVDEKPASNSMGSLFPLVPPKKVNVRNKGEWNTFRIWMEWPRLRVWTNDELIQDVDVESLPEFRHRLRRGYLGLASLSYPIRFRNLTISELPSSDKWKTLYAGPEDMDKWYISEGKPHFEALGEVLRGDGAGHFATKEKFKDFELRCYIRYAKDHNGGVLFRTDAGGNKGRHYEIQLHDVEDAHFPTGSLYYIQRSTYPRIEAGVWFPFHLIVRGANCMVRINGDTVMQYDRLENVAEGAIELQAHRQGYWTEFKNVRIKPLG